jgi:hypothetical protein
MYHKARGVSIVWINGGLSQWCDPPPPPLPPPPLPLPHVPPRSYTASAIPPPSSPRYRASLTVEERMLLAEMWVQQCKRLGMRTVVHVSHMCLRTARDLALHAAKIGADSIGMYPPFAPEAPASLAAAARSVDLATRDVDLPLYTPPPPPSRCVIV